MKWLFILLLSSSLTIGSAQVLSNAQTDSLITSLKKVINEEYIIADKAKLISDSLRAVHYYGIDATETFTKKLNADLYYFSHDKHLNIQYTPIVAQNLITHKDIHEAQNKKEKKDHYGFNTPQILDDHIGYMQLKYFADAAHARHAVLHYLHHFKNTNSLIIDMRENFGGSGTMIQLLSGIFLPGEENEILKIKYKTGENVTMKSTKINPSQQYLNKPVYILCTDQTYSAGEAFAFIMKNRTRAVIVGDTTAGAGNVAGPYPVNAQFVLTVPVGIIVDPLTNTGWEQKGVIPDVVTDSNMALEKTIEMIETKLNRTRN